jgi:hypothetical protein
MVFRTCQRWSKILILAKMTLKDADVKVIAVQQLLLLLRGATGFFLL